MIPDALSHPPDLVIIMAASSSLLDKIQAAQSAASGDLWKTMVTYTQVAYGLFTILDGFVFL